MFLEYQTIGQIFSCITYPSLFLRGHVISSVMFKPFWYCSFASTLYLVITCILIISDSTIDFVYFVKHVSVISNDLIHLFFHSSSKFVILWSCQFVFCLWQTVYSVCASTCFYCVSLYFLGECENFHSILQGCPSEHRFQRPCFTVNKQVGLLISWIKKGTIDYTNDCIHLLCNKIIMLLR